MLNRIIIVTAIVSLGQIASAQNYFSNWPKGSSPQEVGKKVSELIRSVSTWNL